MVKVVAAIGVMVFVFLGIFATSTGLGREELAHNLSP